MPETAVNENYFFVFWEYDIRLPRQFRIVKSIPKPHRMKPFPDFQFGLCVSSVYSGHYPAAPLFTEDVRHSFPSASSSRA